MLGKLRIIEHAGRELGVIVCPSHVESTFLICNMEVLNKTLLQKCSLDIMCMKRDEYGYIFGNDKSKEYCNLYKNIYYYKKYQLKSIKNNRQIQK